jgi:colanic acid/amylovoran biosynthesis glycosyltransferase
VARADLGIQPSRMAPDGDTEGGAPTVILEMQAAGIPVVGTSHADIPAVMPDDELLAPEDDVPGLAAALERVAGMDDAQWAARAERGRALVEAEHDARKLARSLEAMYRRAVDASSTQRRR